MADGRPNPKQWRLAAKPNSEGCHWQGHGHESLMCVGSLLTDFVNATGTLDPTADAVRVELEVARPPCSSRYAPVRVRVASRLVYTYGVEAERLRQDLMQAY